MDVGDDRHARRAHDLAQRSGALDVRARDADDVGPGILAAPDLVDRGPRIGRERVGHRLHGDRGVTADGNAPDHDLAAWPPLDRAPGAEFIAHGGAFSSFRPAIKTLLVPAVQRGPDPCSAFGGGGSPRLAAKDWAVARGARRL